MSTTGSAIRQPILAKAKSIIRNFGSIKLGSLEYMFVFWISMDAENVLETVL